MKKVPLLLVLINAFGVMSFANFSISAETNAIEDGQTYYIRNLYSNLYMETQDSYLQQNTFSGNANQQFLIKYMKGTGDKAI